MRSDFAFDEHVALTEARELAEKGLGSKLDTLEYGEISPDGSAIAGKNRFLFIKGGSNDWDLQISAKARISETDLDKSSEDIVNFKRESEYRGIPFSIIIIPEKDIVYPEFSPNCDGVKMGRRSIHLLRDRHEFVRYPLQSLFEFKASARLYHKRDSHFNAFGGFVIANEVLDSIGLERMQYSDIPFLHREFQDDLAIKWEPFFTLRRTMSEEYDEAIIAEGNPLTGLHLQLNSHAIENGKKILIVGDSYSWNPDAGLCRFMTRKFSEVHFIWNRAVNWELVDTMKPDAIIIQSAERFLIGGLVRR